MYWLLTISLTITRCKLKKEINKISERIIKILKEHSKEGLTILSRDAVSIGISKLEGAKRVFIRRIGMSKIYYYKRKKK